MVNDQQYSMLIDLIDDARAHGARVVAVGHRPGDATRRPHNSRRPSYSASPTR